MNESIVFLFEKPSTNINLGYSCLNEDPYLTWTDSSIYGTWYAETLLLKLLFLEKRLI